MYNRRVVCKAAGARNLEKREAPKIGSLNSPLAAWEFRDLVPCCLNATSLSLLRVSPSHRSAQEFSTWSTMATHKTCESIYSNLQLRKASDIRIVILRPASQDYHDIVCDLQVVSLDNEPDYEALSYTWGPPFEDQSLQDELITLSGMQTRITGNLFHALQRLRFPDKSDRKSVV